MIVYFTAELKFIANISRTENSELEIHIPSCQQQKNGVDCGIFAVANAYYILSGIDVSSIRIDKKQNENALSSVFRAGSF